MIAVSAAYEAAVKADVRRWRPRVEVTWTDPLIDPSIVVTANNENYRNIKSQAADLALTPTHKWAHLCPEFRADGTFYPMPDIASGGQVGYWSALTAEAGNSELYVSFAARPITAILVCGDSIYDEYPVNFNVYIYNMDPCYGETLIYTENVVGNDAVLWTKDISSESITDATKMRLEIVSWNKANRVVKITEFYTSLVETYEGDDVVSLNLLEEREIADGSLPIGNISANELDIELQNIRIVRNNISYVDPFSWENSASLWNNVLKKNRRIVASLGLVLPDDSVEYIKLGTFWSGDWNTSERSATVQTSARDRMELLNKAEYYKSTVQENVTLYALMQTVLTSALTDIPMSDLVWDISTELQSYIVPYGYFPRQSYFKTIKQIVEACRGQAYMNREDILVVTGPSFAGV